jgi:hypothetical protein
VKAQVSIRQLKGFVAKNLPTNSALRELILQEKDSLEPVELLIKMQVWLKLIEFEANLREKHVCCNVGYPSPKRD